VISASIQYGSVSMMVPSMSHSTAEGMGKVMQQAY